MVKAKKIIYAKRFEGEPKLTDFQFEDEELPELEDGDVLVEALYFSVDAYVRIYVERYPLGITMIGEQIARVLESKNKNFPKDSIIHGHFGWRTHTIFNPSKKNTIVKPRISPYILPSFGKHPISLGLGTLGMTGNTAYFGFLNVCKPQPGEVVIVTGAAGAVGCIVGQIAKIKGCQVIGLAGSDDKCKWLTEEIGFDHAINYKTADISAILKKVAPDGIDCFFDNVGGLVTTQIIGHMKEFGRIALCGTVARYNETEVPLLPSVETTLVYKQILMQGFLVWGYADRWLEGINAIYKWVEEGKIKYQETQTDGFDNIPQAFIDMLKGKNIGKAIIKP